ncbi:MAG: Lrp/AsnC family transcriptional regulator [Methanobacteriaceae archaeon]|nr:Lrp/AsnC family transcriptional regulator [Methanobacteriaceae archaeon]
MDQNDKKILKILSENSRTTISTISKKTGIPDTTISNRIKKLEKNTIKEYTTIINPQSVGLNITAIIIIQTESEKHENVEKQLPKLEEISEAYTISGEYDILIKVWAQTLEELNNITNTIRSIDGIEDLTEMIVMERLKEKHIPIPKQPLK